MLIWRPTLVPLFTITGPARLIVKPWSSGVDLTTQKISPCFDFERRFADGLLSCRDLLRRRRDLRLRPHHGGAEVLPVREASTASAMHPPGSAHARSYPKRSTSDTADAGCSVEGVDFEAGVVGDDDFSGDVVGVVDGFEAGVACEGGFVFGWGGDFFQVGEWG